MLRVITAFLVLLANAACRESIPPPPPDPAPTPTAPIAARQSADGILVPTRFEAGRFVATPRLAAGGTLELLVDTGGNDVLFTEVVARLGLGTVELSNASGGTRIEAILPAFTADAALPLPLERDGRVIVLDRFPWMPEGDGVLGPGWFGARAWLLDYPARRLLLVDERSPRPTDAVRVSLGFAENLWFPSVTVDIGGQPIALLFDTGAHTRLVGPAIAALGGGPAVRATSFITASTFDRWRQEHPDWRVIEAAEERTGASMIEVASLQLGGLELGPLWFTRRPDPAFHEHMSRWTAVRVDGALGGNALRDLRVWLDYPAGLALIEPPAAP